MRRRYFLESLAAAGAFAASPLGTLAQGGGRRAAAGSKEPTIEAREFLRFDGRSEDEGFAALVRRLHDVNGPATVRFPAGRGRLVLAGSRQYDMPRRVRWDFGLTLLRYEGQLPGNAPLLRFGDGSEVLGLTLELASTARFDRLVTVRDDTLMDRFQAATEGQISNGVDNADALLQIRGSRVRLTASGISGVDRPLAAIGSGARQGDAQALRDVVIDDFRVRDFVRGLFIRNAQNTRVTGLVAERKSVHAKSDPGHNAVLASRVSDFLLERFRIEESAEHAVRIGGGTSPYEVPNRGIRILDGVVRRPGKSGVKFWAGTKPEEHDDARILDVTVRGMDIADCGFRSKLGPNEDGVRLELVDGLLLENIKVHAERQAMSCHDAVYVAGCRNGLIKNVVAERAARSALYITERLGTGRPEGVGHIKAENIRSTGHKGDFLHMDLPSQAAGPFEFRGLRADGGANFVGGDAPRLDPGSRFDGEARGLSGKMNALGRGRDGGLGDKRR